MPLFAYICAGCGAQSELLVRVDAKVSCPQCGSKEMERQMSRFATISIQNAMSPCAGCAANADGGCPSRHGLDCMA